MKLQNRVIIDINISKPKELFVRFFVHFLCTVFATYFNSFLGEQCFSSRNKVFRADANCIKEIYFNKESFLTARDEIFN